MGKTEYRLMKPKVDFCFKELMKEPVVRKGFLSALLKTEPEKIGETVLLPTVLDPRYEEDKAGILDVRVLFQNGMQMDIEIQVRAYGMWPERSLFYVSRMLTEQIREGEDYGILPRCIHVGILDFILLEGEEFASCFHLREDIRHTLYTDKLEIHILELPKLKKYQYPETELLNWARFFNAEKKEEFEKMADKNEYISKAYETLKNISADEKKRLEYEAREKAILDYNSMMNYSRREGLEEGLELGEIKKTKKVVRNLLRAGMPEEEICALAECSMDLVREVKDGREAEAAEDGE